MSSDEQVLEGLRPTLHREREAESPTFDEPLIRLEDFGAVDAQGKIRRPALMGAMAAWMSMVFMVCYLAIPMATSTLGLYGSGVLSGAWFNFPSFVMASVLAIFAAIAVRPTIRTDFLGPRDPVLSATVGGLLTWGIVHNLSPLLRPFSDFSAVELATFASLNVVEMSLIGMMLASLTKSRMVAFGLGSAFQVVQLGIVGAILSAVLFF